VTLDGNGHLNYEDNTSVACDFKEARVDVLGAACKFNSGYSRISLAEIGKDLSIKDSRSGSETIVFKKKNVKFS
jgi:hypothetical protein